MTGEQSLIRDRDCPICWNFQPEMRLRVALMISLRHNFTECYFVLCFYVFMFLLFLHLITSAK